MPDLLRTLQKINANGMRNASLTDLVIGTVTTASPLSVTLDAVNMPPLPASLLKLTSAVVERKIPVLSHNHTYSDGTTQPALENIAAYENGQPLPVQGGYIILNRGLAVGDKVLLLRTLGGSCYVILSRVF